MNIFLGIMIPFAGTALGAACVFLLKNDIRAGVQKALLGFASGIMVAASVWSLLIPAMEMSESMGTLRFIPAALGFMVGILTLLLMDSYVPHQHLGQEEAEGVKKNWSRSKDRRVVCKKRLCLYWQLHFIISRKEWLWELYLQESRLSIQISRWREHLHWRSELRSRIFRREPSYPCRFEVKRT